MARLFQPDGLPNPGPPKGINEVFSLTVRQRSQEASTCLRIADDLSVPGRKISFSLGIPIQTLILTIRRQSFAEPYAG